MLLKTQFLKKGNLPSEKKGNLFNEEKTFGLLFLSPHTKIHKGPEGVLTITVEVIRSFI